MVVVLKSISIYFLGYILKKYFKIFAVFDKYALKKKYIGGWSFIDIQNQDF